MTDLFPLSENLTTQPTEANLAIGTAVERGGAVYLYDESGRIFASLPAGSEPNDGLKGYTASVVNIRRGDTIFSYDETGRLITTTPA